MAGGGDKVEGDGVHYNGTHYKGGGGANGTIQVYREF